jgi:urease accessory protein
MHTASLNHNVGNGHINVELLGKEAVFRRLSYNYPFKLLSPKCHHPATAIAYMLTYGGGLVGGDVVHMDINVGSGAKLLLLTQVSCTV